MKSKIYIKVDDKKVEITDIELSKFSGMYAFLTVYYINSDNEHDQVNIITTKPYIKTTDQKIIFETYKDLITERVTEYYYC